MRTKLKETMEKEEKPMNTQIKSMDEKEGKEWRKYTNVRTKKPN